MKIAKNGKIERAKCKKIKKVKKVNELMQKHMKKQFKPLIALSLQRCRLLSKALQLRKLFP